MASLSDISQVIGKIGIDHSTPGLTDGVVIIGQAGGSAGAATQVAASVTPVSLLAANAARKGATVYYDGAAILYLLEGAGTPSSTAWTYKLGAGYFTSYEAPAGFTGALQGTWSAAVGAANVTERT